ncbi:MAG TPA: BatD family protein [Opitutaceae bacterium]|nr:BatD family protein [Opitutaceae bacterium]
MRRPLLLPLLLALALPPGAALAQRVYWEPGAGSLAFNQASPLQLVFENCEPDGDPQIPSVDGLELQFTGSGSTFSMENMSITRRHILNFAARPTKRPEVRIPAFAVATDKGTKPVAAATFAIGNATVGQSTVPLETAVRARLTPADGAFWAGEVFPVTYTLDIARRFRPRPPGPVVWKPAPLTVEDWGQPEQFESTAGGEPRVGLIYRTRGYIATPGTYHIPAASQEVVLVVDTSGNLLSFPFSSPEMVQHTVTSNEPALTIKPLPDGAPADFGGAVGQFTFTSKVVPTTVAVGEPITWTLELGGTGSWPDIHGLPAREVSKDFKVLQPQAKRNPAENRLFEAALTEDAVLIPTKPGTYTLGPVSYSYFDPRDGAYKTVTTEAAKVTITPPVATGPAAQSLIAPEARPPAGQPKAPRQTAYTPQLPAPPAAPAAIPRDPLPGTDTGPVPLRRLPLALGVLGSVLWLLPAWLILAAVRARRLDPLRTRREARARLAQTLAFLRGAGDPTARAQALHAWQRDAATLLGIAHAAPTSTTVASSVAISTAAPPSVGGLALPPSDRRAWTQLWAEADRVLYGPDGGLPANWLVRAEGTLENTRVPGWQLSSLFAARSLLPWLGGKGGMRKTETEKLIAALVLLILFCGLLARAPAVAAEPARNPEPGALNYYSSPLAAYNAGAFAAAEEAWRAAIGRQPTDWVARHNLALALAQQGHWPEAAAQWTSAFVLNPRDDSVRWHLALGFERAGYTPPGLGEFAQASGPHLVARLASPAECQWLLVFAGALLAAGALLLLLRAYRGTANGWTRPAALVAMGVAVLLALAAAMALHFYGDAADPRAAVAWHQALLRSIPTEADTQQKTSSLPAGSLAVVDKTFLGWVRLAFPNGQTGWVRQEDIVWLYR